MTYQTPSQYLLRWNDHLSNYGDLFFSLRDQEEFVDCSIACDDGIVGAHRVVLAGCSPYLRDLFSRVANPHPVIFLLNTSRSLILLLMEFIYRGQVHIPQHRLQQLVLLGQALKVKGLTQIMVPVSSIPDTSTTSITPLAMPQDLPLPTSDKGTNSTGICISRCESGTKVVNGEEEEGGGKESEEEEEEAVEDCPVESSPRKRKRRIVRNSYRVRRRARGISSTYLSKGEAPSCPPKLALSAQSKREMGAFALEHGVEATRRHIKNEYKIHPREATVLQYINLYKKRQARLEKKKAKKESAHGVGQQKYY